LIEVDGIAHPSLLIANDRKPFLFQEHEL
jgi:hypothetical protein